MDLGLEGKRAFVTGASRGIGKAIASSLFEEGCRVALMARHREGLEKAREEITRGGKERPEEVLLLPGDVTLEEDCRRAMETAVDRWGAVDILVNNAGGSAGTGPFLHSTEEEFRRCLELNTISGLRLSRLALPGMLEQKSGVIIFIASIWGREWGGSPAYNLAKTAVISLAKSLSRELAPYGIRVLSVAPGSILHPGGSWERRMREDPEGIREFVARELPYGRFGRPEEVASVVTFLASPRAALVTGSCIPVDGGQSRSLI